MKENEKVQSIIKKLFCSHLNAKGHYEIDSVIIPPIGDKSFYDKCKTGRVIMRFVCPDCKAETISHVNEHGVITDMNSNRYK